jgi:small-conductance mechanosensitive channel/CRP-like cAMP-binding protein
MPFDLQSFSWTLDGGLGLLAALVLILLLLVFLPGPNRRLARGSVVLLALHLLLLGLRAVFQGDTAVHLALDMTALFLLLASIGRSLFLLITQSRLTRSLRLPPKIFLDLIQGFIYLFALLITLSAAGVEPTSLFAGSALLTAVIGLSLRDTLGNLFAGLAIHAQRPFEVGDWIQFDADPLHIGQVMEINWRATKVLTTDKVEIIIPNGVLGQAPIVNYTKPEKWLRRAVLVNAPNDVPPERVHRIILAALVGAKGVLERPAPSVVTHNFDDRGVQYRVRFYIDEFGSRGRIEGTVRDRIWYALTRHGIDLPTPLRQVHVHKAGKRAGARKEQSRVAHQVEALRGIDFLDHLPDQARQRLASLAQTRLYADQEVIIRQGEPGDELFIVEQGEVAVSVERPGEPPLEVARLGPRSFFGEMALLTGEPRSATVRAVKECELLVVGKSAFAQVIDAAPDLAERISETIALRHADQARKLAETGNGEKHPPPEHSHHHILQRIKEFFSI